MKQLSTASVISRSCVRSGVEAKGSRPWLRASDAGLPVRIDDAGVPLRFDPECDHEIPRRVWSSFRPSIGRHHLRRPLTEDERGKLASRAAALELALRPYTPDQEDLVVAAVMEMLGGFRALKQEGAAAVAIADTIKRRLTDCPLWAIEEACRRIGEDRAGLDKRYAPNDSEIVAAVADVIKPYALSRTTLERILTAPVEPPPVQRESRPTGAELEAKLGRRLGAPRNTLAPKRREEIEADLVRLVAEQNGWMP